MPPTPSNVRVIDLASLPCECLPPPFKCWVNTVNELPLNCSINGQVYTVVNVDWCDHPVQFFCWGGAWHPVTCGANEDVRVHVQSNKTQVDYGVILPGQAGLPHAITIGTSSSWNTMYNVGGFSVLSSGGITIPEDGVYLMTGNSRIRHLMPILDGYPTQPPPGPGQPAWPPVPDTSVLPHWVEAHWVSGLQIVPIPTPPFLHSADQQVWAFKTPSYAQAIPGFSDTPVNMSIGIDNSVAGERFFQAGQVITLQQDARDGQPVLTEGAKFWIEHADFTIRKVARA